MLATLYQSSPLPAGLRNFSLFYLNTCTKKFWHYSEIVKFHLVECERKSLRTLVLGNVESTMYRLFLHHGHCYLKVNLALLSPLADVEDSNQQSRSCHYTRRQGIWQNSSYISSQS
jgi:hypothetical protein